MTAYGNLLQNPIRRFHASLFLLLLLIGFGTVGYMIIEGYTFLNALYMTIITITTVGFKEMGDPSTLGKIFTIVLIILGVGAGAWAIRNGVEVVLGDTLWNSMQLKKMNDKIDALNGHFIVCGYGRIGRQIVLDMGIRDRPFVVIDMGAVGVEKIREQGYLYVVGDATQDETLLKAGIERAAGLIVALNSDADNVLAVLTARGLNPDLQIVARAGDERVVSKLKRAGADRVVSTYAIGGHRLALSILQPTVHDFFTHVFNVEQPEVDIGEIFVAPDCYLADKSIVECDLRQKWDLTVIGIKLLSGEFTISPDARQQLQGGETLIVIGDPVKIREMRAGVEASRTRLA